jgi:uncharacterized protein YdaT
MPWSETNFPNAMKNLPKLVRDKAIQIGNAILLKSTMKEGQIIATAISNAKRWAERRGLLTKNSNSSK